MEKLDIKAGEVLFVGDNLVLDIKGSQEVDMRGVWFNPTLEINKTNIKPDHEISALENILELLK